MEGDIYIRKIEGIKNEIARRTEGIKTLREQKRNYELQLYKFMEASNKEKVGTITKKSIAPKDPVSRKKKTDMRKDTIDLLRKKGFSDPRGLWESIERLRKK